MKCKYCKYPYDCKYYKDKNKDKNIKLPQNNFEEYYKNISNKITKKQREYDKTHGISEKKLREEEEKFLRLARWWDYLYDYK